MRFAAPPVAVVDSLHIMEPRAISRLLQLSRDRRPDAIAAGLEFIAEHCSTLGQDILRLTTVDGKRGAVILNAIAEEEAAKALILLDVIRAGWRDQGAIARQLKRFSDHLARCIYAELAAMRPATFGEVRTLVETYRIEYFLDGPNDVDWIFRNQLLEQREQMLYVDYVHTEEGDEWRTPATADDMPFPTIFSDARDLVTSLHNSGCLTRRSLDVIADVWSGFKIDDDTHWQAVRARNVAVIEAISSDLKKRPTSEDSRRVIETWGFPLVALNLGARKIAPQELEAERSRRIAEWSGY